MSAAAHRIDSVDLDPASLAPANAEIEHERRVAIFDLLEQNLFRPEGAAGGPYRLRLSVEDSRLVLDIEGPEFRKAHMLSLTPLKTIMKDYFMICESYQQAVRGASPGQIEAVDMGRRGLHNEGSDLLRERLAGKVEIDHETARRLFTLICALYRRS